MKSTFTTTKRLARLALFACFTVLLGLYQANAQTVNTYTFAQTTGTYTPIVGTTIVAANSDDVSSTLQAIGFTFVYEGNNFTTFGANSNGSIRLGALPSATTIYAPLSTAANTNAIAPLGRDGRTFSGVSFNVVGAVGSRVLTVQFADQNMNWTGTVGTNFCRVSAQIKLYETTNVVQFVYTTPIATGTAQATQIGLRGATTANFSNRTTSFAASTAGALVTTTMSVGAAPGATPVAGRTFTWTPPVAAPLDLTLTALVNPIATGCYGANQTVTVTVRNNGSSTWDFATNNATVNVSNTGATTNNPIGSVVLNSGTLAVGATQNVTVSTTMAMTTSGTYRFRGKVIGTGDGNAANDSLNVAGNNYTDRFVSAVPVPYTQTFPALPNPPFLVNQVAGTGQWTIVTSGNLAFPTLVPTNPGFAYFNSFSFATGTESRLWLPCMDFSSLTTPVIKFKMDQSPNYTASVGEGVYVEVSTNGGGTWVPTGFFAPRLNTSVVGGAWVDFECCLSAYAGNPNVRIGLRARSEFGDNIALDQLVVEDATTCTTPTTSGTTAITFSTATFNWQTTCLATSYNLSYGPVGGPYTPVGSVTGSSYNVTGLSPGTAYQWQIQANCPGPTTSSFSAYVNFQTPFPPPVNDACPGSTLVPQNPCTNTAGTGNGATSSGVAVPTCSGSTGTAEDDVWYQFSTGPNPGYTYNVTLQGLGTYDGVLAVYQNNGCVAPTLVACVDATFTAGTELLVNLALTPSTIYRIRCYDYYNAPNPGNFNICVTYNPPAPPNDNCLGAILLSSSGTTCVPTVGNNRNATASTPASVCGGTANEDVWYRFTAVSTSHLVTVVGSTTFNPVIDVLSGTCAALTNIGCADLSGAGGTEALTLSGLTIGNTYFIRVYDQPAGIPVDSLFDICVTEITVLFPPPPNDPCASAQALTPGATCVPTAGTTLGGTNNPPLAANLCSGTVGNPDDDVWYSFVAASAACDIIVAATAPLTLDPVVEIRSNACPGTLIQCEDATGIGGTETLSVYGLTIGTTYKIRVFGRGFGYTTSGSFDICVVNTTAPPPPANDNCAGAVNLTPAVACVPTAGNVNGATASTPASACVGTANDDVWYTFTATQTIHNVNVTGSASFDAVIVVYSGTCAAPVQINCTDITGNGATETANLTGLTVGNVYRIRVYDVGASVPATTTFTICVTNPAIPPPPPNDECLGATSLVAGNACILYTQNITGATPTAGVPVVCPFGGTANEDVWFKFIANATSEVIQVNGSAAYDAVVQVFSGTCGALTSIQCADATLSGQTEYQIVNGLTIGNTYYIRVFDWYSTFPATTTFTICVVNIPTPPPPTNDLCIDAIGINCGDILAGQSSGYSTSTSDPTGLCGTVDMTGSNGIWYKTTGDGNVFRVNTCNGTTYDTRVAVYTGTCGSWTCVGSSDNQALCGSGLQSQVTWTTTNGTLYYILVGGTGGAQGIMQLQLECFNCPTATVAGTVSSNPTGAQSTNNDTYTFFTGGGSIGNVTEWRYAFAPVVYPAFSGNFAPDGNNDIALIARLLAGGSVDVWALVQNGPGCLVQTTPAYTLTPRCASQIVNGPLTTPNYITNVEVNTINNNSTFDAFGDNYQDFRALSTTLQKGFSYAVKIKTFGTAARGRMIWIDWDGNGLFNGPGEAAITPTPLTVGTTTSIITVPCTAITGSVMMRVMSTSVVANTDPCFATSYASGQIEEYTLNLTGVGYGVWTGAVNNNWNDVGNWACATIPTGSIDVTIPLGAPNTPPTLTGSGFCRNITFQTGAPLYTSTGVNTSTFDLNIRGNILVSGSTNALVNFSSPTGYVEMSSSTTNQTITGRANFQSLVINNTFGGGTVTLNNNTAVSRVLTTTAGTLVTNGKLFLKSTVANTALVNPTGTGSISGNVSVERKINAFSGYHYLASPVSGAFVNNTTSGWRDDFTINAATDGYVYDPTIPVVNANLFPTVWEYDETINNPNPAYGWVGATGTGDPITPLKGFACIVNANTLVDVFGPVNNGNIGPFAVTNTDDGANLIGNPYPSPISWVAFQATNTVLGPIYLAFVSSGSYAGNYGAFDAAAGVNGTGTLGTTNKIASSQGIFVTTLAPGTVSANNTHRLTSDADVPSTFFSGNSLVPDLLRMELHGNGFADEMIVYFDKNASDSYSNTRDGLKMFSPNPGVPGLFTIADNHNLCINVMGEFNGDRSIPVGIRSQAAGTYELDMTDMNGFAPTVVAYLEDVQTGTMQNLRSNPTYTFTLGTGDITNRFILHFRPAVKLTADAESCSGNDGKVTVNYPSSDVVNITLKNAQGVAVATLTNFNGTNVVNNLAAGNYVAEITFTGGYMASDYVTVAAGNAVSASMTASATTVDVAVNGTVTFTANAAGAISYNWNFGDGSVMNNAPANVSHTFTTPGVYDVTFTASNGACDAVAHELITVTNTTGIAGNSADGIKVTSNLSRVVITFGNAVEGKGTIEVLDLNGKVVAQVENAAFKGTREIEMNNAVGTYLVRISNAKKVFAQKVYLSK